MHTEGQSFDGKLKDESGKYRVQPPYYGDEVWASVPSKGPESSSRTHRDRGTRLRLYFNVMRK